jgi:serine protease
MKFRSKVKAAVAATAVVAAVGAGLASQAGAAQVASGGGAPKNLSVLAPAGAACLGVAVRATHAESAAARVIGRPSFLVGSGGEAGAHWVNTGHQVRAGQWVRVVAFAADCATVQSQKPAQPKYVSVARRVRASDSTDYRFSPVFVGPSASSKAPKSPASNPAPASDPTPTPAPNPNPVQQPASATPFQGTNYVQYNGGANGTFTESPKVYLVFYGSQWNGTGGATQSAAEGFFKGLGTGGETWSRTLTQYCSGVPKATTVCPATAPHIPYPTSTVYGGTWFDDSKPAPQTPDDDLISEAHAAAAHFGVTDLARSIFVILSPAGTKAGGGTSWHTTAGEYNVVNAAYGWQDTNVLSHEYAETLTDVSGGWTSPDHANEVGDLCGPDGDLTLTTGSFPVVSIWSNAANACVKG